MTTLRRAAIRGFNVLASSSAKHFKSNLAVGRTPGTAFSPIPVPARLNSVAWSRSGRRYLWSAGSAASGAHGSHSTPAAAAAGVSMAVALATYSIEPRAQDTCKTVMCAWGWGGGDADKKDDDDDDSVLKKLGTAFSGADGSSDVTRSVPAELSFGFAMGVCCGVAVKKTGTFAMVGVGLIFGTIQALSYLGFVTVEYEKIQKTFDKALDMLDFNKNGRVDADDARTLYEKVFEAASVGLPAGSGFSAGAILGFRRG